MNISIKKITALFVDITGGALPDGCRHLFRQEASEQFDLDFAATEQQHKLGFVVYKEGKITLDEYLTRVAVN